METEIREGENINRFTFPLAQKTTWKNKISVNTYAALRGIRNMLQRGKTHEREMKERKRQRRRTRRAQTLHCIVQYKRVGAFALVCVCYVCERERERETTAHTHKHTLTVVERERERETHTHTHSTEPPVPLPTLHTARVSLSIYSNRSLPAWVCAAFSLLYLPFVRSFAVAAVVVVVAVVRLSLSLPPFPTRSLDFIGLVARGSQWPPRLLPPPPPPTQSRTAPPFFMDIFFFIMLISFFTFARDFFCHDRRRGAGFIFFFFDFSLYFGSTRKRDADDSACPGRSCINEAK